MLCTTWYRQHPQLSMTTSSILPRQRCDPDRRGCHRVRAGGLSAMRRCDNGARATHLTENAFFLACLLQSPDKERERACTSAARCVQGRRTSKREAHVISASFWSGRRVLLTGHTGFKGGWTALLLQSLGAEVHGLALPPAEMGGVFAAARVEPTVRHNVGDTRNIGFVRRVFAEARPQVVLHMAAQPLVRVSYVDPVGTYATNVMGTVHVLECSRQTPDVKAVVVVTTDKCYENVGQVWGYRETERLGGHDPYSSSKACAELVTDAYRRSFFSVDGAAAVASVRAGNVIGGGDWSEARLVPDAMRAFRAGSALKVRNHRAIRPWQHVLDPVIAYLGLAERLVSQGREFAEAWNFGPPSESAVSVAELCDRLVQGWGGGSLDGGRRRASPRRHRSQIGVLESKKTVGMASAIRLRSSRGPNRGLVQGAAFRR